MSENENKRETVGWERWWKTLPTQARNRFLSDTSFVTKQYPAELLDIPSKRRSDDEPNQGHRT